MKNTKLIIIILVAIILLLVGFIVGKGFFETDPDKKAEIEYDNNRQESNQQIQDSAARMRADFQNINKTR